MSAKFIGAVCFKLFSIYLLVSVAISLPTIWLSISGMLFELAEFKVGTFFPYFMTFITLTLGAGIAYVLWLTGSSVINKLPEDKSILLNSEGMFIQLLGVFFFVTGLADLPYVAINVWKLSIISDSQLFEYVHELAPTLIRCIVGSVLFLKAEGFRLVFNKIRDSGA